MGPKMVAFKKKYKVRSKSTRPAMKRSIKRVVRSMVETKYKDTNVTHAAGTSATVTALTDIAAGDTNVARSGQKVFLKSLSWRMFAQTDNDNYFGDKYRIIIFRDTRQVGDTIPTSSQLLETATDVYSHLNKNNGSRFKVLKDFFFQTSPAAAGNATTTSYGQPGNIRVFKGFKRLKGTCYYNGSASTDIERGGLYILQLADRNTAMEMSTIVSNLRLRWTDV